MKPSAPAPGFEATVDLVGVGDNNTCLSGEMTQEFGDATLQNHLCDVNGHRECFGLLQA